MQETKKEQFPNDFISMEESKDEFLSDKDKVDDNNVLLKPKRKKQRKKTTYGIYDFFMCRSCGGSKKQ